MFSKKLKLRNLIDKHQDTLLSIPNEETPPPPSISDANIKYDVCLDINARAFECLLYGFIRQIVVIISYPTSDNVLDDVMRLCLTFYNAGFENLKFDLFNLKYSNVLYNEILKGSLNCGNISCHRVFSTSIGFNIGVQKWKIKHVARDTKSLTSPYGGIGIVSENKILRKENKFGNYYQKNYKALNWINHRSFGNVIYFDQASKCLYQYIYGKGKILYSPKQMKQSNISYQRGDVMTIILDCNRWKLKILRNDQNILKNNQEIDITKKYIAYYPVVAFYHHGDTYRVLRK